MFRVLLALAVVLSPAVQQSDAGLFRNIRANRAARGAVVILPRLRERAIFGQRCGSSCATSNCATCPQNGECVECEGLEGLEARQGRPFVNALRLFGERQNMTSAERTAFRKVLGNPVLRERFREEVGRRYGIDINNIGDWLELFVKYAPEIIKIILQIVSIFAADEVGCQNLTPYVHGTNGDVVDAAAMAYPSG